MHELSIALNILDIAMEEAEKRGGVKVKAIHLKVGAFSGVVKEALESAFELARENSPFETTDLIISEVPVLIRCEECQTDCHPEAIYRLACPHCGNLSPKIVAGREMELTALEIEE